MKQNYFREAHDSVSAHHMSGERYIESIDKTIVDLQEHIRTTEEEIQKLQAMRNVLINVNAVEYHREEPEMPKTATLDDKTQVEGLGLPDQLQKDLAEGLGEVELSPDSKPDGEVQQ